MSLCSFSVFGRNVVLGTLSQSCQHGKADLPRCVSVPGDHGEDACEKLRRLMFREIGVPGLCREAPSSWFVFFADDRRDPSGQSVAALNICPPGHVDKDTFSERGVVSVTEACPIAHVSTFLDHTKTQGWSSIREEAFLICRKIIQPRISFCGGTKNLCLTPAGES